MFCARSIGSVPVHGLLKSLRIPLGELDICNPQSSRGGRLRVMTGITHLQLIGQFNPMDPDVAAEPEELVELQLLMTNHANHMPLLTSLKMSHVHLLCVASVAASLRLSCPTVTTLKLSGVFGGKSSFLWSALAGARSLRHLVFQDADDSLCHLPPDVYERRAGDFSGLGAMDQLHSLCLKLRRPLDYTMPVPVSRLTALTRVMMNFRTICAVC